MKLFKKWRQLTALALAAVLGGALLFGSIAGAVVLAIAWAGPGAGGTSRLILAGIAVGAMFGAATTSLMVAFSDPSGGDHGVNRSPSVRPEPDPSCPRSACGRTCR